MPTDWKTHPIHVIDFEGSDRYGVIEFGVATVSNGAVSACQTALCRAEGMIDERDSWQHGLRREDTVGEPPFTEYWAFFNGLRQSGYLAAHHAGVEERLLKRSWPYPTTQTGEGVPGWGPWVDTRVLYQRLFPQLNAHKLGALVACFGLQEQLDALAGAHCPQNRKRYHAALYDALASAVLLLHLGQLDGFEALTLEWLLAQSQPQGPTDQQQSLF